jgi:hypothetical protein
MAFDDKRKPLRIVVPKTQMVDLARSSDRSTPAGSRWRPFSKMAAKFPKILQIGLF